MTTLTFATLKFANKLKAAGVPEKQAEAEAEALAEVMSEAVKASDLTTNTWERCLPPFFANSER